MISRASLRPTAFLFSSHGVCASCQKYLLVRGAARAPSTKTREDARLPWRKARSPEEIVAKQLGQTYMGKDQKSMPRMPIEILMQAHKAGRLKIQVRKAEQIMREFETVMKKPNAASLLVDICYSLNVELAGLTGLGSLLLQSKNPVERILGRNILLAASRAGLASATIFLVNAARRQDTLAARELVKPQQHLKQLVKSGEATVQALVLQGMIYQKQGMFELAASLFEQAIALPQIPPDESQFVKFMRRVGFDLVNPDPNLDSRRPEDLELDVVQAYVQLSGLQYGNLVDSAEGAALENMKVAALKYDDPVAYFQLAGTAERYSLEWLEYTRKAAASGYSPAMEDIAALHALSDEKLQEQVKDDRVRDWVLNNPLFDVNHLSSILDKEKSKKQRTFKRYQWATKWYAAAGSRASSPEESAYRTGRINWEIADLLQDIGHGVWPVRLWRVVARKYVTFALRSKESTPQMKAECEVVLKDMLNEPMGRETAALLEYWQSQKDEFRHDQDWMELHCRSIEHVPPGQWERGSKKRVAS